MKCYTKGNGFIKRLFMVSMLTAKPTFSVWVSLQGELLGAEHLDYTVKLEA